MSVQSQIDRINRNVANTYAVLEGYGATMPDEQNSDNLSATAASAFGKLTFDPTVYGLPVLYLTGDTTGMSKDNAVPLSYVYGENGGSCTLKWQGASSIGYDKKNYTIKFDTAIDIGYGEQKKYCLKANWIDHSHARNIVTAKLWGQAAKTRSSVPADWKNLPNAGAVDGFPCVIMLNGEFHGLYTFNIPKDGWMFGLVEDATKTQAIVSAETECDAVLFKATALLNKSDFELEFVSDESNSGWAVASLNQLISSCIDSWGGDLDTKVSQYLDWESAIDYYIFTVILGGSDMLDKNFLLVTLDGTKWYFSAYDMDTTYALKWDGSKLRGYDYAVDFKFCADTHRVFELIKRFKTDALKARYEELRSSVWSESNVYQMFENFAWAIPSPLYMEDVKRWPSIPGSAVNGVDQILRWVDRRLAIVDKWASELPEQETPVEPEEPDVPDTPSYTNLVPTSIGTDGNIYNSVGYKDGYRLSSSGAEKENDYSTVTGFIPATKGNVVRIAGCKWYDTASAVNYLCAYDKDFVFIGGIVAKGTTYGTKPTASMSGSDTLAVFTLADIDTIAYVRISCYQESDKTHTGANVIVTVNEEIT